MWELLQTFAIIAAIVYVVAKVWSHLANSIPSVVQEELEWRRAVMRLHGLDDGKPFTESSAERRYRELRRVYVASPPMTDDEKRQMAEHLRRLETAKDLSIERNEIRP